MKYALTIPLLLALVAVQSHAQASRIWRCGNTYTNSETEAKANNCKPMEGGNVTVVEGTRVNNPGAVRVATSVAGAAPNRDVARERVDPADQKSRDTEARAILEAELKKAQARLAELQKEYANGEPEKMGAESRNYQKYLDRVAEIKANLTRTENDIAGIQRELNRFSSGPASALK